DTLQGSCMLDQCVARERLASALARSGGRAGHRPRARGVQAPRALGRPREVELLGSPLPRARLSHTPRAGDELLRGLREPARRPDAAGVLTPGEPGALRPDASRVDDVDRRPVVHPDAPGGDPAHAAPRTRAGAAPRAGGPALTRGRAGRLPRALTRGERTTVRSS